MKASDLILRCYGYHSNEVWTAICLDFNLVVKAENQKELKDKMHGVIESYIETVLDTDDKESIASLMMRKAPLKHWIIYYFIATLSMLKDIPGKINFKQAIPFQIIGHC